MHPQKKPKTSLHRFLVEDFYKDSPFLEKVEEVFFEDFIIITVVSPPKSTFTKTLLTLIEIYKDLR